MSDEQRLLDVISRRLHKIGRHCMHVQCEHFDPDAESVLAALREAIADDPDRVATLMPEGLTWMIIEQPAELDRHVKLGRAVEAINQQISDCKPGYDDGFVHIDDFYTDAGVERQP